jgi:hypothetical protein
VNKTNRIIILTNLVLSFIVVIMIIKGLHRIAYTHTIVKFQTGNRLGGSILTIQSNNTFIYETFLDISPNYILRGTWNRLNDTIMLNGSKCFRYDGLIKESQKCIEFVNAKFLIYDDSIVHVSGKSSIINMRKYVE